MNTERINEIADLIEAGHEKLHFDMGTWGTSATARAPTAHLCGTAACIAGWTLARFGKTGRAKKLDHRRPLANYKDVLPCAASVLGLELLTIRRLFTPSLAADGVSMPEVTAEHAVRTLRHLAKTGKVDWVSAIRVGCSGNMHIRGD